MDDYLPCKKGGRPRAAEADKRQKRIFCYVSAAELRSLDEARQAVKGTRAAYIRDILLKKRTPIQKIDSKALSLILKMSANLNQIARRVNSVPADKVNCMIFENELTEIRDELKKVHFAIIGGEKKDESKNNKGQLF